MLVRKERDADRKMKTRKMGERESVRVRSIIKRIRKYKTKA